MRQRYNNNAKENQLGLLKVYAFCQKIQQKTSSPGECCWCYVSIYENAPIKLLHLPPKSCHNFTQQLKEGQYSSYTVMVGVKATC